MSNFLDFLNLEEKFALLYGILLGDGCLSKYRCNDGRERFSIVITGNSKDEKCFYEFILIPLLKSFSKKSIIIKKRKNCNAIEINLQDKILFDKINNYGFPIGKKGETIKIPDVFYKNDLLKYVIQGFFSTDGSFVLTKNPNKYYPRIEGTNISKTLIKQITDYLIKLNLQGNFYLAKRKKLNSKFISNYPIYRFQFNGKNNLSLFRDNIGFINLKHEEKYQLFIKYSEEYDNNIKGIPTQKQRFVRLKI